MNTQKQRVYRTNKEKE